MSRGLGKVERAVLEVVPEAPETMTSAEIALLLFGTAPTDAQVRGLRLAIKSLAGKGLVVAVLAPGPLMVRDVVTGGTAGPRMVDRGYRLGHAVMHHVSRPGR